MESDPAPMSYDAKQDSQISQLRDEIKALESQVDRRMKSERDFSNQLQAQNQRAEDQAERVRDKAAQVLKESLQDEVRMADGNLLQHIQHQKEQVAAAFAASEKAIQKAETAVDKRLDGMNEIRQTLVDQQITFVGRLVFEQFEKEARRMIEQSNTSIGEVGTRVTEIEARGGGSRDQTTDTRQRNTLLLGIIGSGFGALGVITAVIVAANAAFN